MTLLLVGIILSMPGVDTKGLAPESVTALEQIMKEGPCPCDPQKSMLQCIEAKSCAGATNLANYGADKLRKGLGADQLREAVIKKFMDDNVNFTFDLKGVPKKGAAKGRIVIVEFADFECPHCALMGEMLGKVVKAHPKAVTVYFKNFPLPHHMHAEPAARASLAAHKQGRFWPMHDMIFANQMKLKKGSFAAFAAELGLNVKKFQADMESDEIRRAVLRDRDEGIKSQLQSTPTLYINQKLYHGDKTLEGISAHIKSLLKKK